LAFTAFVAALSAVNHGWPVFQKFPDQFPENAALMAAGRCDDMNAVETA